MSKPIFSDLYSISTRRNRQSFIFFFILIFFANIFVFMTLSGIFLSAFTLGDGGLNYFLIGLLWLFILVYFITYVWMTITSITVSLQRYNDVGYPRKWFVIVWASSYTSVVFMSGSFEVNFDQASLANVLLWPLFLIAGLVFLGSLALFIILVFISGQKGENQYGLNPLDEYAVEDKTPKSE